CQSDGTQTRTVISSSNCSDTDKPVLTQQCNYIPSPEELFRKEIEELNTTQKIIDYLNNNFKLVPREGNIAYSPQDFFEKKEGGEQDFAVFTSYVLHEHDFVSFTFAYEYENNNQRTIKYVTSVRDTDLPKYIYFDESGARAVHHGWSFRDLCRKEEERLGIKILRYGMVSPMLVDLNPQEWAIFREESNAEEDKTLIEKCNFTYSSWSECQPNGKRTRNVISFFPENCEGGEPKLIEDCDYVKPTIPCIFTYSPWSECQPNGTQTRKLISKMPANCSEGDPVLAKSCAYIEPVEPKADPVVTPTAPTPTTPTTPATSANTISDIVSQAPENVEKKLGEECLRAGINNEEDCDIFNYQMKIVPECLSLGLTNQDQCRDYFLSNYGRPLKCEILSDENCAKLINDVILSALEKSIDEEKKNELVQVSGSKATINVVNNSPVISILELEEKKEIKMESLPISVKENESISVKLIPIETNESQKGLSPVAISISSEGNELPDDVVTRIGQDFEIETLSGVDRAIVEGKPLEQPKFNSFKGESLIIENVETEEKGSLVIRGKSKPGEIITLFIYSSMPIVVTVQADQDGNWTYSLDKSMVDGTHEVYAVLHNDEGRIIEASTPKIFFVAETRAISMEEMFLLGDISEIKDDSKNMMTLYLLGGISIIIILVALLLIAKRKTEEL
ncbi:MAG: Calcium-binding acidic-repeat protein (ARP), partial [Parcubacteria bacterium 34_609]